MVFPFLMAASVVSGAFSAINSIKSSRAAKRAQQTQRDQQEMRAIQERRQAIRATRMSFAANEQRGENAGVSGPGSSGLAGGGGSILTQGNANLNFLQNNMVAARKGGMLQDQAASYASQAGLWGSISGLAQAGMGFPAGQASAQVPTVMGGNNMTDWQKIGPPPKITGPLY